MKTILFVDDDTTITECFQILFSDRGYNVLIANEGKQALDIISKNKQIDLLVTDLNMPNGMGGVDLINSLPDSFQNKKVAIMSGYVENELLIQNKIKISAFLSKPISAKKIMELL